MQTFMSFFSFGKSIFLLLFFPFCVLRIPSCFFVFQFLLGLLQQCTHCFKFFLSFCHASGFSLCSLTFYSSPSLNFIFQLLLHIPRTSFLQVMAICSYFTQHQCLILRTLSQLYFEVYSPLCIIPSLCLFCCGVFFSVVVVFFGYLVIPVYLGIFVNERLGLLVMSFVCFYNLCVSPVLITGQTPQKEALYGSVSLCS